MVEATSYPFLEVFWTMLIFFAFIIWIWILFVIFSDLFRRHDMGGFAKVLWIVLIIIIPYLGAFIYLIAYHKGMAERQMESQKQAEQQFEGYVQSVAAKQDPAEQIAKAKSMLDAGTITQAEFDQLKQKALAGS
ncbi:MAG TPA: SHOCT domain-containing protein [Solirubrobacteraceae bacterium]|nr:SHOCT domain-containing protein [Solirubrobacteraceae bacterium]